MFKSVRTTSTYTLNGSAEYSQLDMMCYLQVYKVHLLLLSQSLAHPRLPQIQFHNLIPPHQPFAFPFQSSAADSVLVSDLSIQIIDQDVQ